MAYVRCIKNKGYEASLEVGRIYKTLPATRQETRDGLLRVIDSEGEDYLYDSGYFEAVDLVSAVEQEPGLAALTVHISPLVKGILQAEALALHKSVGALVREWIDERLDLPAN